MIALGRRKYLPIGLQMSDGTATAVQLAGRPGQYEIHAMAHGELPYDEAASPVQRDREIAAGLRELLSDHRFHGRQAVSCIGSQELFVQNVRLPQLPANEVEKVVRWEAEERLPYPVDEAEVRHLVAGRIRQDSNIRQEVILLACHHGTLTRHVSLLEQAGLTPQAIDIEPIALLRCLEAAGGTAAGPMAAAETPERVACLNFAERATTVVFAEGGQMLFLKYIATGGHHLDLAVARHLNLTLEEATRLRARVTTAPELDPTNEVHRSVADAIRGPLETLSSEIELCFRYYKVTFRGRELNRLAVTGPESCSWLATWLGERLGITAELVNPFSTLSRWPTSPSAVERPWRWTAPFGLSLRGEHA